MLHSEPRKR